MKNKHVEKAELLAPAGSFQSMKAALCAGADAVYMGGSRFGARAYAENAGEDQFLEAIDYAHLHGRRLYLTLNTLLKPREMEKDLYSYVEPMYRQGLDGVIIQDAGVAAFLRREFPGMPLHASTQMTITGPEGARAAARMGFVRVVPARELLLTEIREIAQETGMELEVFLHGALCYCYSGQCLMSSLIGGRSGNRGRCAGTCRLPYRVDEGNSFGQECDALSLKDLCGIHVLPDLVDAGVYSFKIEGRMKSPLYASGVTSVYRKYLDLYLEEGREAYAVDPNDVERLRHIFDRGFTDRYFTMHNGQEMMSWKVKPLTREIPPELVKELEDSYIKRECEEQVEGRFVCEAGKETTLSVRLCDAENRTEVVFAGKAAEAAKTRAVTEAELLKALGKTGNTPYRWKNLEVVTDGASFLGMGEVNAIRRQALEKLTETVVGAYRRELPASGSCKGNAEEKRWIPANNEPANNTPANSALANKAPVNNALANNILENTEPEINVLENNISNKESKPEVLVYVEQLCQLPPVLRHTLVDGVILDSEAGGKPGHFAELVSFWGDFAEKCHKAGKKAYLAMPYIFRIQSRVEWKKNLTQIRNLPLDGFLARVIDEAQFVRENDLSGRLLLESSLYAMNPEARQEWERLFSPCFFMAPLEEKEGELSGLDIRKEGLLLYGRLPMMVTAGCIQKNFGGCKKTPGYRTLCDRKGDLFPVRCSCTSCMNVIFNSRPLSLLGCKKEVLRLSPAAFRLNFTVETEQETERVLKEHLDVFLLGRDDHDPSGSFTRGHFKRGVE